jgi:hypothetical protein
MLTINSLFKLNTVFSQAVQEDDEWFVIMTVEKYAEKARALLLSLPNAMLGGRTALLRNGTRVSVVTLDTDLKPDGKSVMFFGLEEEMLSPSFEEKALVWRKSARKIL